MFKSFFISILFCIVMLMEGSSQLSTTSASSTYSYRHPSADKPSWQRLNLWLASSYKSAILFNGDPDSSLIFASQSLGMSRLPIAAEGIDNAELLLESQWFDQRDPQKGVRLLSQASGKKHLELMILLGAYYGFQSYGYKHYKDSIEYFLKKAFDESKKVDEKKLGRVALCLLVKLYAQRGDTVNRNSVLNQLIKECESTGDRKTAARALFYRGLYTFITPGTVVTQAVITDLLNTKIEYLNKAGKMYHDLNDAEGEIVTLVNAGYLHGGLSQLDEAYTAFEKALNLENSISYPYTHYTTDNLALITTAQIKFGEPLKYCLETINTAEAVRDSIGWATFYARLGLLYHTDGQKQEESLKWMSKALDRYVMVKDAAIYQTLYNVVDLMIQQGGREREILNLAQSISKKVPPQKSHDSIFHHITFAICYMGRKEFKQAEEYALKANLINESAQLRGSNTSYERSMIYTTLASIYFAWGQYAKAKKYIELDLADSERAVILYNELETYKQLIYIDSIFHDDQSAVVHYKKYMQLVDSNFRASKLRQAEELQVMYETKEKENEIELLNDKAKLENANLKQATTVRNVTIGGIVVALIVALLLYRQSRLRKKTNEVITYKNEQLQHLLTEKEWLLKEIHHRVKNNLQIVMSLLNSQSSYIENDAALTAIHDSQHRVHAMSLIHQKLYNSENVSSIDMQFYIRELVSYLSDSFVTGQRIRFELNIKPLEMDVSQAVPLGLILNEAITNSIKYAFPNNKNGIISISLVASETNHYLLTISDNGIGIPVHVKDKKPGSLGMSLMAGLSEDIDGNFSVENNNGTIIRISFVHDQHVHRQDTLTTSFISNN